MRALPQRSDWQADRLAEARALITDVANHGDHLIRLACKVLVTHGETATPAARPALAHRAGADRGRDCLGGERHPQGSSRTARWAEGAGPRHAARRPAQDGKFG